MNSSIFALISLSLTSLGAHAYRSQIVHQHTNASLVSWMGLATWLWAISYVSGRMLSRSRWKKIEERRARRTGFTCAGAMVWVGQLGAGDAMTVGQLAREMWFSGSIASR